MPIRPENKGRYPANWLAIRKRILNRSAHRIEPEEGCVPWPRCELCNVPDRMWIERTGPGIDDWALCMPSDGPLVILTIAHLSEEIEDCSDENLRAWCQRCHNRYDAPRRAAGIKARRRAECAAGDLFCEETSDERAVKRDVERAL